MRKRKSAALLLATLSLFGLAPEKAKRAPTRPASPVSAEGPAAGTEKRLVEYAGLYLPWDPDSKVTVQKATLKVAGFTSWRVQRTGRYETLNAEAVVFVSNDGKWFFEGDSFRNPNPRPVQSEADLTWISSKYAQLLGSNVRAQLVPERDAAGLKGMSVILETGFGPVRSPGLVTPDGSVYLAGALGDFQADPRAERRRRIDLTAQRASGPADAAVTIVEYADMECPYCRFRGRHLDKLLAANAGIASVRRHYKFFPLWTHHAWAMKAASAGDCLFRLAGAPALFRFKELVYGRQENLSVSAIDELAITSAEGESVARSDYLGCYLRDDSFDRVRKDIEEGYRLGVNTTPTYFVDGTEIVWTEDKVMEDFLRTKFPRLKSIVYEK
jgi:protein-disulfide isomerase